MSARCEVSKTKAEQKQDENRDEADHYCKDKFLELQEKRRRAKELVEQLKAQGTNVVLADSLEEERPV